MNFALDSIGGESRAAEISDIDPLRLLPTGSEAWTFENAADGAFPIHLRAKISVDGYDRRLQLQPEQPFPRVWPPLFMEFRAGRRGLAIEQFSWLRSRNPTAFAVAPPLLVTPRVEDDHVDVLIARGWDWSYPGGEPAPRPLVPPVPGQATKIARSVTLPGIPGSLQLLAIRITAKNTLSNVILTSTMQFVEGIGLVTHSGQAYGTFFGLRRRPPLMPNTPQPTQPVFGIQAHELLGLTTMKESTFRNRSDGKERTLSVEGGPSEFRFAGDVPTGVSHVRWGGQGLELLRLNVWGQPWTPPASVLFSTRILDLAARPSWSVWSFGKPAVKGPAGQELSFLVLRMTWSDDASEIAWAAAAAGPYQNIRPRYLLIEYQALDSAGSAIPPERTALALTDQRLGILRVARQVGAGKLELWDLYAHT